MSDITVEFYDAEKMIPSPAEPYWCIVRYFDGINEEPFFTKALRYRDQWTFNEETKPVPKKITHWAFLFND